MKLPLTLILLLFVSALQAGTRSSANYAIPTDANDGGGTRTTSAAYANDGSLGDVMGVSTAAAPVTTAKQGYVGQLYEVTGLEVTAAPAVVNEGLTRELIAHQVLDDGSLIFVPSSSVSWSVVSGPLIGIDANGVVSTFKVHGETGAVVQGTFLGKSDTLGLTILETGTDTLAFPQTIFDVYEEAGVINVPVVRTGSTDGSVTVQFSTSLTGATATLDGDYEDVTNHVVTFAHGESVKEVPVTILSGDADNEPNETFTVVLGTPGPGAVVGPLGTALVRIADPGDLTFTGSTTISQPLAGAFLPLFTGAPTDIKGAATDNKGIGRVSVRLNSDPPVDAALTLTGTNGTGANYVLSLVPATGLNTIEVQAYDTRGNPAAPVSRSFTVTRPLAVQVNPVGDGSVTAGFTPSPTFREVGKSYSITATPKTTPSPGTMFTGWTLAGGPTPAQLGIAPSALEKPTLTFIFREGLELTANFVENPYDAEVAGTYNGLIKASPSLPDRGLAGPTNGDGTAPGVGAEGYFTATVMNGGPFSGKLTIDGFVLNVAGTFDHEGRARFGTARADTLAVARPNKPSLQVKFNIGGVPDSVVPPKTITGEVRATEFRQSVLAAVSTVSADRAHYTGTTGPLTVPDPYLTVTGTAQSPTGRSDGVFTVVLPPVPHGSQPDRVTDALTEDDYPKGAGVGTLKVTKAGAVTLTATLADGTAMTAAGKLSQDLRVALFAQLYSLKGFFSTELQLDNAPTDSDVGKATGSEVLWNRPFIGTSQHYPYGWAETIEVGLLGAKYVVTPNQSVLKAANGVSLQSADADGNVELIFTEGLLTEEVVKSANLSTADVVTKVPSNDPTFTMAVNRTTGAITGVFDHTDATRPGYNAVILQKGPNAGAYGYFLTKPPVPIDFLGESGRVEILGQP